MVNGRGIYVVFCNTLSIIADIIQTITAFSGNLFFKHTESTVHVVTVMRLLHINGQIDFHWQCSVFCALLRKTTTRFASAEP